ncbi:hypothetical protein H7D82_004472 [Salmonella enterica]|nr:hypothetical protein [Salmonella enterica]EKB7612274.1 hypothetical protein [Salmonella enterica]
MSIKTKLSLAALCVATMASGSVSALTNVGNGTVGINGTIGVATCTVAPSVTSVTIPQLDPVVLASTANGTEVARQSMTFDFKDCNAAGNAMTIKLSRDVAPPTGTGAGLFKGGFSYNGGAATDSATGPIAYQAVRTFNGTTINKIDGTDDTTHSVDISGVADKSAFQVPYDFVISKAPYNGVHPSQYAGNYTANVAFEISYP